MLLLKYSILFLISFNVFATFNDMDCLNSVFESTVSHKGKPFGLTDTIIKVSKDKCLITIDHEEMKYKHNKWVIDICREPIHIKSGTGSIEVLKKAGECNTAQNNKEFCKAVRKIELVLQDDGLIFADGEKEDLSKDHGRLYCSFLILKSYLNDNFIYSQGGQYENTLIKSSLINKKESCPIPTAKEKTTLNNSSQEPQTGAIEPAPGSPADGAIPDTSEAGKF